MYYRKALCAQQENVDQGTLQITVHSKTDNRPVENALVRISYTGDPNSVIEEVRTDSSGNTPVLQLKTPPLEYSLNASEEAQPYAEYSLSLIHISRRSLIMRFRSCSTIAGTFTFAASSSFV